MSAVADISGRSNKVQIWWGYKPECGLTANGSQDLQCILDPASEPLSSSELTTIVGDLIRHGELQMPKQTLVYTQQKPTSTLNLSQKLAFQS